MTQLDDRARSATAALLSQVDDSVDAAWTPKRSHPRLQLAAAFAVLALVIAGVVVYARSGDDDTTVVAGGGPVPRLIARTLPDGWSASGAADLSLIAALTQDLGTAEVALYAESSDDNFNGPSIALTVIRSSTVDGEQEPGEPVDVNGHAGTIDEQSDESVVAWLEAPDVRVLVTGRGLDRDALLTAARSVVVDTTNADVTAPPDGLSLRSHVHDLAVGRGLGLLAGAGATGHVVGYKSGDTSSVEIMLLAGDDDLLQLQRYFLTKGGSDLQVRGHPGWVSTSQQPRNGVSIVWQEAPGVIGVAGATGLDQAGLLEILDSLSPATDEEWNALLAQANGSSEAPTNDVPADALASKSGTFGGTSYVVYVLPGGELGFVIRSDEGSSATESGATPQPRLDAPSASLAAFDERFAVVYGKAPSSVATVRMTLDGGDMTEGPVEAVPGQPFGLFALGIEVSDPARLAGGARGTVVFLDADGAEVTGLPVAASVG